MGTNLRGAVLSDPSLFPPSPIFWDAVVAIGGGAGTLSEIAFAWIYKRLIVALEVPGWSSELANRRIDQRIRYPDIADDRVYGANSAEEAVAIIVKHLPAYAARHRGFRAST